MFIGGMTLANKASSFWAAKPPPGSMAKKRARAAPNIKRRHDDGHRYALLLIDVVNRLDFDGAEKIAPRALAMARRVAALRRRAVAAGVPCVYVNDNFGQWRSDLRALVARGLDDRSRGQALVQMLQPGEDDYFVLKPLHSGFYSTTLDLLLRELGSRTLILCGLATEACVLFTASDAYIRGFEVIVPNDGCASESPARHRGALAIMRKMLKCETTACADISFGRGNVKRRA